MRQLRQELATVAQSPATDAGDLLCWPRTAGAPRQVHKPDYYPGADLGGAQLTVSLPGAPSDTWISPNQLECGRTRHDRAITVLTRAAEGNAAPSSERYGQRRPRAWTPTTPCLRIRPRAHPANRHELNPLVRNSRPPRRTGLNEDECAMNVPCRPLIQGLLSITVTTGQLIPTGP